MVFSLLHAGTSRFSLEQAVAHLVSPDPCGLLSTETRVCIHVPQPAVEKVTLPS